MEEEIETQGGDITFSSRDCLVWHLNPGSSAPVPNTNNINLPLQSTPYCLLEEPVFSGNIY